ncbi:MAG: metallophosphoesterase family protein [Candidatus Diapherotrites archaeon]|nr:metallophosphoesterase family protein [Candidatus Diapherotrites archaeon]
MRILALSDIHQREENLLSILNEVQKIKLDLAVIAGDLTNYGNGTDSAKIIEAIKTPKIFAVPGNLDGKAVLDYLEERNMSLHNRKAHYNGFEFCGFGGGLLGKTGELLSSELEIEECLGKIVTKGSILVTHLPPKDTPLDFTEDEHIGSSAIKKVILENKPFMHICGHAHNAHGRIKLGETICINVASVKDGFASVIEIMGRTVRIKRISV